MIGAELKAGVCVPAACDAGDTVKVVNSPLHPRNQNFTDVECVRTPSEKSSTAMTVVAL